MGIIRTWDSKWFSGKKKYAKLLHQDLKIRKHIEKKLSTEGGVAKIEILRSANQIVINIHSAKPGSVIGLQGETVESLKKELEKLCSEKIQINIKEVKKPALIAKLVAENIVKQIEKRISYRRAAKMSLEKALEAGALGGKIAVKGRLNGVEIARSEFFSKGKVPLQTLRADIDYAYSPAFTSYGVIGVKVWIYRGLIFKKHGVSEVSEVL